MSKSIDPPTSQHEEEYRRCAALAERHAQQALRLTHADGADPGAVTALAAIGQAYATLAAAAATMARDGAR